MIAQVLFLRDFADPESLSLETQEQARCVIRAIEPHPRRWVDLDFSGITGVSWDFTFEFIRVSWQELPEIWLSPKHYDQRSAKLIAPLVYRLERLREQEWIDGCELFSTGVDPRQKVKENQR